eukprot:CAMPEP_0203760410 /NCGR_PEP_ID=MMETSP0098-20131031/13707_1 /ASSEMBLY_ACC=CAM_ASM_000208 /TAXON_ID=96639 /ORGANISM=" , Strain NY0313808BC1" /LENGTH=1330 /DNA_ID=CAMNT_0050653951 /DNA_START=336 /DNA_END=4324 /DNA_ORIENTATION=+
METKKEDKSDPVADVVPQQQQVAPGNNKPASNQQSEEQVGNGEDYGGDTSGEEDDEKEDTIPTSRFAIDPLELGLDDNLSAGECRCSSVIVGGSIESYSPKIKYALVAYVLQDESKEEVQRLDLDGVLMVDSEGNDSIAAFKVKVSGLQLGGLTYMFDIWATYKSTSYSYSGQSNFDGERKQACSISTMILAPSPPVNFLCVGRSKTGIKLRWQKPICDGGSKVVEYRAQQMDESGEYRDVYLGVERSLHLSKLCPGKSYTFRVVARNERYGDGDWTTPLTVSTMASTPSAPGVPTLVQGTSYPKKIHVEWTVPLENHGSPIKCYSLELFQVAGSNLGNGKHTRQGSADFKIVYNGKENICLIERGIIPFSKYTLRVRAENGVGWSPYSSPIEVRTLGMPPEPPSIPVAVCNNNGTVSVHWRAPNIVNGGPLKLFSLEYAIWDKADNSYPFQVVYTGTEKNCELTCLEPGGQYRLRVLASNEYGWSDHGPVRLFSVKPTVPSPLGEPPRIESIVSKDLQLAWNPAGETSRDTGGSLILGYSVMMRVAPQKLSSPKPRRMTHNTPVVTNRLGLQVITENNWAKYQESDMIQGTQKVNVGDTFEYLYPEDECYYVVEVLETKGPKSKIQYIEYPDNILWTPNSLLRPRLDIGDLCRALCLSQDGCDSSMEDAVVTSRTKFGYWVKFPEFVLPLQEVSASDIQPKTQVGMMQNQKNQFLDKNSDTSGESNKLEEVEMFSGSTWKEVFSGNGCNYTVCGLTVGVEYQATVLPFSAVGKAPLDSSPVLDHIKVGNKKPDAPPAPKILKIQGYIVTISLEPPGKLYGCALQGYHLAIADCREETLTSHKIAVIEGNYKNFIPLKAETNTYSFDIGKGATTVAFRYRAFTVAGNSPWSISVGATSDASLPDIPRDIQFTPVKSGVDSQSVEIRWKAPEWNGGKSILDYSIEVLSKSKLRSNLSPKNSAGGTRKKSKSYLKVVPGSVTSYIVQDLPAGGNLSVRVRARNEIGEGEFSEAKQFKIDACVPGMISNGVIQTSKAQNYVKFKWAPPVFDGGEPVIGYETEIMRIHSNEVRGIDKLNFEPGKTGVIQFHPSETTRATLKGLESGCEYVVRVRGVNSVGNGVFSPWAVVTTESRSTETLAVPINLRPVSIDPLQFCWDTPKELIGVPGIDFWLEVSTASNIKKDKNDYSCVYRGTENSYTFTNTLPDTTYKARVRAISKTGSSPFSGVCGIRTVPLEESTLVTHDVGTSTISTGVVPITPTAQSRSKDNANMDAPKEQAAQPVKLVKASHALKLRKMKWYKRYPKLGAVTFALIVVLIAFLSGYFDSARSMER